MQNYQDAQAMQSFAQVFGVSPVPPVKADAKKLLASTTWGESAVAARLEQAAIDKKYVADIAKFIVAMPPEKRPRRIIIHSFNFDGRMRIH